MKITSEEIEALLEDDTMEGQRLSKAWYGSLGPLGFRVTEFQRTRLPVVGVTIVTGSRVRFEVKGRNRGDVLRFMANWVNSLNPDRLQGLVDFLRYGQEGPPAGRSAWERLGNED